MDKWLRANDLNEIGDPPGIVYIRNPLKDPVTGEIIPRIDFLRQWFTERSWCVEEELRVIDLYLSEAGLKQYGDEEGTVVYPGGTPLFDERTGVATPRYD